MRLVAVILICAEAMLVLAVILHPIMTSHRPVAAAINQYHAAPSPAAAAEVRRLQEAARTQDRAEILRTAGLLSLNTCILVAVLAPIRRQNLRLRAAPVTGLW
jgi:hypothetical protein